MDSQKAAVVTPKHPANEPHFVAETIEPLPVATAVGETHHLVKQGDSPRGNQAHPVGTRKGVRFKRTGVVWEYSSECSWPSSESSDKSDGPHFTTHAFGVVFLILTFVITMFVFWSAFRSNGKMPVERKTTEDISQDMLIPAHPAFLAEHEESAEHGTFTSFRAPLGGVAAFTTAGDPSTGELETSTSEMGSAVTTDETTGEHSSHVV